MKTRIRASLRLKHRKDADLLQYANTIISCLTGNPHYPAVFPELEQVKTDTIAYHEALLQTYLRTLGSADLKKKTRRKLHFSLTDLSRACIRIADGSKPIFTSSGFSLRKPNRPVHLGRVNVFKVFHGKSEGIIHLKWKRVKRALLYIVQFTHNIENEDSWEVIETPAKTKLTLRNLQLGKRYWFRVAAQGRKERGGWSNEISRIVA